MALSFLSVFASPYTSISSDSFILDAILSAFCSSGFRGFILTGVFYTCSIPLDLGSNLFYIMVQAKEWKRKGVSDYYRIGNVERCPGCVKGKSPPAGIGRPMSVSPLCGRETRITSKDKPSCLLCILLWDVGEGKFVDLSAVFVLEGVAR